MAGGVKHLKHLTILISLLDTLNFKLQRKIFNKLFKGSKESPQGIYTFTQL